MPHNSNYLMHNLPLCMSQLCGGRNSRSHAGLSPASHPLPTLPSPLATSPLPSPLRSCSPPPITTTWSKSASPFFHASSATAPSRLKQISSRALPPTAGGTASARLSRCTMSKSVVPSAKWPCTTPYSAVHASAWPCSAAMKTGVAPAFPGVSTFAPSSASTLTTSAWPPCAAT